MFSGDGVIFLIIDDEKIFGFLLNYVFGSGPMIETFY